MTIDIPTLDEKTYDELVAQAVRRLPAYEDGWTDYNPGDPGITILELLAHLTDTYSFQLDSISDDHRRKYLGLIGETVEPPSPAAVRLTASIPTGTGPTRLPAGTPLTVIDRSEGEIIFEVEADVDLIDATIDRIITDLPDGQTDHTEANEKHGMSFFAFGQDADPPAAMYLGFDNDPFRGTDELSIVVEYHDDELPPVTTHPLEAPRFFPSVHLVWEFCTDYDRARRDEVWNRLTVTRDGTYAFHRGGRISMARPDEWDPAGAGVDEHGILEDEPGRHWIRCRVVRGGYEIPPQLDSVATNIVDAIHRRTVTNEPLQRVDPPDDLVSLSAQTFAFEHRPILDADIEVDDVVWTEVADFDASGPTDCHYVLDRDAGRVRFGDGVHGRRPEAGESVIATRYSYGGGRKGNVSSSSIWRVHEPDLQLTNEIRLGDISFEPAGPGTGGTDAGSLESAFERAKRDLRKPYRAITRDDYLAVAKQTPGLRVGRATVLVDERPDVSFEGMPIETSIVVVPYVPASQPRPMPSEGFLEAVQQHCDKYRLVTDRVVAVGPTYVDLVIDLDVEIETWMPHSRVKRTIETRLSSYLHPIHGFDGDGWPFGRTLYSSELDELLKSISFVNHIRDVSIHARGPARVDGDQNVLVGDSSLFAIDEVTTNVESIAVDQERG